ncbi:uncharacterized protein LOC107042766 [Diachasma alloeum]|uniref:uncharacterized protein LOC107042766 n=1 Tax=Diachasma alloeum TaxID=454923 RepID=UPI000738448B|nr:uncharacterized protein LOC107042766 [Diachasma alloeum]
MIPEERAGFRRRRCAMDNPFTLQTALQARLRLTGGKVCALFVDFRRAFDSLRHRLLWSKLAHLGVNFKKIRNIKRLYDRASIQIRTSEGLPDLVNVSECILQRKKLSRLFFNLFLSDIVSFFNINGDVEVDVDARTQVPMLLYADDLVIFANSPVDLRRKLGVLESYCEENSLTINIGKTKIMGFRRGGPLPKASHAFAFNGSPVDIVRSYVYLGVTFSSSSMGSWAAKAAAGKAKAATASALDILFRIQAHTWDGISKLYDSLVASTLLYTSWIWGLRAGELRTLENAQLFFLKKLPRNAPGYLVRLETGVDNIRCKVLRQAL